MPHSTPLNQLEDPMKHGWLREAKESVVKNCCQAGLV